jgi:hypothetical protein
LAYPFHPKVSLRRAVGYTDNLIHFRLGVDSSEFRALLADVGGEDLLGKNLPAAVRPKNSHRDLNLLTGLSAFAHIL